MNWYDIITPQYIRNAAIGYMQDAPLEVFDIFPKVDTRKMEGLIPKYKKEDWFKIGSVDEYQRAGSSESVGDTFASDKSTYRLLQYSFHKDVTEADQQQFEEPYQAIDDGVKFVVNRLRRVALKIVLDTFVAADVWGNNEASPTKWDAKTNGTSDADPVDDVLGWQQAVEKTTGFKPNKMIITPDVYKALRLNTHITKRLSTTQTQVVTKDLLASLFDLDRLEILNAVNEDTTGYIAAQKALLVYTPPGSIGNKFEPSGGYIMTYSYSDGFNIGTKRIPMPARNNSLRIEGDLFLDPVVPAPDCGYYISNLVD